MAAAAAAIVLAMLGLPSGHAGAVRTGLTWLADQQKPNGHWAGLDGISPTTITATAGLALLMEGSTPKDGTYAPHIRKAIEWFETKVVETGCIGTALDQSQYIPAHANALLFLASAYDTDDDPVRRARVAKVLGRAAAFLAEYQTPRGGWGLVVTSNGANDEAQSTTTVLQALLAARKAGIEVPKSSIDRAFQYLAKSTTPNGGVVYSLSDMPKGDAAGYQQFSAMAAACALMQDGAPNELLGGWASNAGRLNRAQAIGFLSRGNGAYAMILLQPLARAAHAVGDNGHRKLAPGTPSQRLLRWSEERAKLFSAITEFQRKDGSWPDQSYGPNYATALALVILQLDNGYLPAFAR